MTILQIVTHPNDILTTPTEELTKADILSSEIQTLIENMIDTCLDADGLGLAANQVGVGKSLIICRKPGTNQFDTIINPKIVHAEGSMHSKGEGCLSLPGQHFNIKRFKKITVTGLAADGETLMIGTKSKRFAKIVQHELDHLDGFTLLNRGKKV